MFLFDFGLASSLIRCSLVLSPISHVGQGFSPANRARKTPEGLPHMTTHVNCGFRVTSAKFHWGAISFCSLVTLQGELQPADVPFDLVEQHLIVARGSVAGLRGLNLGAVR